MSTQLFLQNTVPDTHLATNNANLRGTAVGWFAKALATTRGSGVTSAATSTVAGPTPGIDIQSSGSHLEFISPPVSADVTISGTITLNIWASENNASANVSINAVIEVIRANATATADSNTLVEIARSTRTTEVAVTTRAVNNFTVTPTSTVLNRGDRLRVRIFGDDSGGAGDMASGFTFSVGWNGTSAAADGDTYVTFTEDFSFESAPAGSVLYLTDTASDVATASVDREAWTSRGGGVVNDVTNTATGWTAPIQMTDTAGGTVVDWFSKQLKAFMLTGKAVANLRALESNLAGQAALRCEIARVDADGTNATVWATWCMAPTSGQPLGRLTTSEAAETANVSGDDLAFTNGQRIRIRLYLEDSSENAMGASQTVTVFYAGTSAAASGDSYVTLAQSVTEFVSTGYQRLYGPAQLGTSAVELYTAPDNALVEIRRIWINNPSGATVKPTLSIGADAASTRVIELEDIAAGAEYDGRRGVNHTLEGGETIQGYCDTAATAVIVIDGYVEEV